MHTKKNQKICNIKVLNKKTGDYFLFAESPNHQTVTKSITQMVGQSLYSMLIGICSIDNSNCKSLHSWNISNKYVFFLTIWTDGIWR